MLRSLCWLKKERFSYDIAVLQGRQKGAKKKEITGKSESQAAFNSLHKDTTLSTFHALGKLLYNKREEGKATEVANQDPAQAANASHSPTGGSQMQ